MSEIEPISPAAPTSDFCRNKTQRIKNHLAITLYNLLGVVLCFIAALICAKVFIQSPSARYVPLGFVVILLLIGARFGTIVSVLGAVMAALVFAYSLYPPLGSFRVTDGNARESLLWMLLCAFVIPTLLFPPNSASRR
jgi:K+-sensing histidine kinase KdpD